MLTVSGLFIKDEVVLTGDQSLHSAAALHILVTRVLHSPLTIPSGTVANLKHFNQTMTTSQHQLLGINLQDQVAEGEVFHFVHIPL